MSTGTELEPLPTVAIPAARPVPGTARLPSLDALRGLALLGVLAVNLAIMTGPEERFFSVPWSASEAPLALAATHLLFTGKAYALLSFLFGAGLALQLGRLGPRAPAVLPRRLLALGAIGAAHGLLLWFGDILAVYAVVGAVWWLAFARRGAETRGRWALALFVVVPLLGVAAGGVLTVVDLLRPEAFEKVRTALASELEGTIARSLSVYGSGTLGEIFALRAAAFVKTWSATFAYLPQFLALFLAGGWAAERGLFFDPGQHRRLLARVAALGVLLGGAGELAYAALVSGGIGRLGPLTLGYGIHAASAPALALGVAAALLLAWSAGRARVLLKLAPLGRLSLSAYLSQSVLFTTVAYAYGGGLYGKLAPDMCLVLAAVTWLVQALLAALWLSRFETGPAEWLWRRLAYGERPGSPADPGGP